MMTTRRSASSGKQPPSWVSGSKSPCGSQIDVQMTHPTIRSLKNHGMDADVEAMFDMGREAMALPLEEKMKYELGDEGGSFGFVLGSPSSG